MSTTMPGGYYLSKHPGGYPINADGKRVEMLTEDEIAEHIEKRLPARIIDDDEVAEMDVAIAKASTPKKSGRGKKAEVDVETPAE